MKNPVSGNPGFLDRRVIHLTDPKMPKIVTIPDLEARMRSILGLGPDALLISIEQARIVLRRLDGAFHVKGRLSNRQPQMWRNIGPDQMPLGAVVRVSRYVRVRIDILAAWVLGEWDQSPVPEPAPPRPRPIWPPSLVVTYRPEDAELIPKSRRKKHKPLL